MVGALGRGGKGVGLFVCVVIGCSSEIGVEDTVPSERGIVMPEGGGSPIAENVACERLLSALSGARSRLSCPAETASCPQYVRPAGSQACLEYDEATVAGCENLIEGYTRCSDFESRRCIVSALPGTQSPGCIPPSNDAGSDVETDAAPDAETDGAVEAAGDASDGAAPDSAAEAGQDSAADSGSDTAVD